MRASTTQSATVCTISIATTQVTSYWPDIQYIVTAWNKAVLGQATELEAA